MAKKTEVWEQLSQALAALRTEVAQLSERIRKLETANGQSPHETPPVPVPQPREEEISEEIVLVISAAIAAYLGMKPRIRQIRLAGGAWGKQGRVTIQASHALAVHRH